MSRHLALAGLPEVLKNREYPICVEIWEAVLASINYFHAYTINLVPGTTDQFTVVSLVGTGEKVTDTADAGGGDNTNVLGDKTNDQITVTGQQNGTETYAGYGYDSTSGQFGQVAGVIGETSGGQYILYTNESLSPGHHIFFAASDPSNSGNGFNVATGEPTPCFMAGTLVATPDGDRTVETLKKGDLVLTSEGKAAPVLWIGTRAVSTVFSDPIQAFPIRIKAGALADGLPSRDLLLSPDHAVLVDGVLIHAGALVNGTSIVRESKVDLPKLFTYYHVELSDHSLMVAEGAPAETFIDNVGRMAFDNWAEREASSDGDEPQQEMHYPRAKSARQVPVAIRVKLSTRGAELYGLERSAVA